MSLGKQTLTIDPVGRTEGHIGITIEVEHNKIVNAKAFGPLYRGFEKVMMGRDPREAQDLPTRICGVCPMVHTVCGSKNIEMMFGVPYNENARLLRNIAHAAHMVGDHALHFYHLAALDFITGPDKPPFTPRYEGDYRIPKAENDKIVGNYIKGLEMRRKSQEAAALYAGKLPHAITFVPGGVSEIPTKENLAKFMVRLEDMEKFVNEAWLPDVEAVAKYYPDYAKIGIGVTDYLSFGVFELDNKDKEHYHRRGLVRNGKFEEFEMKYLTEDVKYTQQEGKDGQDVWAVDTKSVNPDKKDAYSFITAANYKGKPVEVGPFARLKIDGKMDGDASVLSRHVARAQEAADLIKAIKGWTEELRLGESAMIEQMEVPDEMESFGLSEAPRGACGHWMKVKDGRIDHWQSMPATNFNGAPRNANGDPGPFEMALIGTPIEDINNPLEAVRVIRSFDPCMACSVHVITPDQEMKEFVVSK